MEGGLVRFFQSKGKDFLEILMLLVSTVCACARTRVHVGYYHGNQL